jgi:hypothetical protein
MNTEQAMTARKTVKARKAVKAVKSRKRVQSRKRVVQAGKARRATTTSSAPQFAPEQVATILKLLKGSNSVELKLVVPATGHRATVATIGLDPVEAQPRQAFFFDTPDLALNKAGLIVRARRIPGGRADTVIKLRPVDPSAIDPALRRSASFKVELDAMPGGFVCSGSLKGLCTAQEVLDVTTGATPLKSLFSKEQLAFFDAHAPAGIKMDSLLTLGPTFLLKAKHNPKNFNRRIVIEMWLYPDGSRILEISTKSPPEEAFQVAAEFKSYLASCGITLGVSQETKTRSALEYFTGRLE